MTEPRKAAVSLIQREDGRVLCVWNLRYDGFSLPGGMVEDGETVDDALRRELREETSLEIVTAEKIFEGEHHLRPKTNDRSGRASVVAIYRVTASGVPREVEKGCRIEWLTWEEFLAQSPFGAFYREILPRLALDPSPRVWPPHEFVSVLAEAVDHLFDPHEYPWSPESRKRVQVAREAARAWLVDFGDCTMTERSSAYGAFIQICEMTEHDSPIYRIAVEELSALGHAIARDIRSTQPVPCGEPTCGYRLHTGPHSWEQARDVEWEKATHQALLDRNDALVRALRGVMSAAHPSIHKSRSVAEAMTAALEVLDSPNPRTGQPGTPEEHVGWRCSRALCTWSDPMATGLRRAGPCPECGCTEIVRLDPCPTQAVVRSRGEMLAAVRRLASDAELLSADDRAALAYALEDVETVDKWSRDVMPEWRDLRRVLLEKGWDFPGKRGLGYDTKAKSLETERGRKLWDLVHGDVKP